MKQRLYRNETEALFRRNRGPAGIKQKLAKKELQVPPRQSTAAKQRKRTARHTQTLFWKRNLQNSVSKV
ncbi:MAG: hypothetical protein MR982_04520 [Bacteroides pyogenes]|uniref:hypothetical protein n=1 Tax=Bacteroides pyogenes TaxID=310300 RepID=UPI000558BFA1|nr:hypothetical protein [Bacteroides pyogenes]MCF2708579.1 hypothetical protein [Bacteroides pyogenes]MCI7070225.1 hypothetical protein [Bacteroides pyogenes]MDY5354238.1 hypothetical protein [Bacteroides pyogenes]